MWLQRVRHNWATKMHMCVHTHTHAHTHTVSHKDKARKWREDALISYSAAIHDGLSQFYHMSLLLAVTWKNIPWNWMFLSWECSLREELSSLHEKWEPQLFTDRYQCNPCSIKQIHPFHWWQYLCHLSLWIDLPIRQANSSYNLGQKGKFRSHP